MLFDFWINLQDFWCLGIGITRKSKFPAILFAQLWSCNVKWSRFPDAAPCCCSVLVLYSPALTGP